MPNLAKREISRKEAEARTAQHQRDFRGLEKGWAKLGRAVAKSLELGVPEKLGTDMDSWLESTFNRSASHIRRQLHNLKALADVPAEKLEAMPEGNAQELARLPSAVRVDPQMVDKAVREKPAKFRETVAEFREKKMGLSKPEQWATYARRAPKSVVDELLKAEQKVAHVLKLDLSEDCPQRGSNLITILEAWAALINNTDDAVLLAELEGKES